MTDRDDAPASPDEPTDTTEQTADDQPPAGRRKRRIGRWIAGATGVLVVLALLAAVIPVSSSNLDARPDPSSTYEDALDRFEDVAVVERQLDLFEPCRSKLLDHGERTDRVVVLFHGLTNCPEQFDEFAHELFETGANVLVLRAPHHGLANDEGDGVGGVGLVGSLSAQDLRDYADDAVDIGVGLGEEVEVLGLSMGGVLSLWTAQFREDVDEVVAVAPAISIPRVPHFLTTAFVNLGNRLPNISLGSPGVKLDHAYAGESTGALAAMFLLARAVGNEVPGNTAAAGEVVVVLNPDDDQVDNGQVESLVDSWGDSDGRVEVVTLPSADLPHDLIDPGQPEGDTDAVYPRLLELLETGSGR